MRPVEPWKLQDGDEAETAPEEEDSEPFWTGLQGVWCQGVLRVSDLSRCESQAREVLLALLFSLLERGDEYFRLRWILLLRFKLVRLCSTGADQL